MSVALKQEPPGDETRSMLKRVEGGFAGKHWGILYGCNKWTAFTVGELEQALVDGSAHCGHCDREIPLGADARTRVTAALRSVAKEGRKT